MNYTLYTAENCHQCADVIKFMNDNSIEFDMVNVDLTGRKPPVIIYAFPALFLNEDLLAYGTDIKNYFNKKSHSA